MGQVPRISLVSRSHTRPQDAQGIRLQRGATARSAHRCAGAAQELYGRHRLSGPVLRREAHLAVAAGQQAGHPRDRQAAGPAEAGGVAQAGGAEGGEEGLPGRAALPEPGLGPGGPRARSHHVKADGPTAFVGGARRNLVCPRLVEIPRIFISRLLLLDTRSRSRSR